MKEKIYTISEFLNKIDPSRVGEGRVGQGTLLELGPQAVSKVMANPYLKKIVVTAGATLWYGLKAYADTAAAKNGIWNLAWKVIDIVRYFAIMLCIGLCFRDIIEAITEGAGVKDIFGHVVKYGIIIVLFWAIPELFLSIPTYFGSGRTYEF